MPSRRAVLQVNVEKKDDGKFEVEASGLPGNKDVRIGLRRGDSLTMLDTVETDAAGKLSAEIEIPAKTVEAGGDAVIVVETADERVRLVSDVLALD
jgi:sporulation protein YlmC with PRC-barrel domain